MKKSSIVILSLLIAGSVPVCTDYGRHADYLENYERGKSLYLSQKLEDAIPYFEESVSRNRKFKQAYIMLAKCHYYLNRELIALDTLEKVLKIYPDYVEANFWAGKIHYFLNELDRTEDYLLAVVEEDSNHIDARYLLADIYFGRGSYDKALLNYTIVETNLDIIALAKIKKSEIYANSRQYKKALEEISFIEKNRSALDYQVLDEAYRLLSRINREGEKSEKIR